MASRWNRIGRGGIFCPSVTSLKAITGIGIPVVVSAGLNRYFQLKLKQTRTELQGTSAPESSLSHSRVKVSSFEEMWSKKSCGKVQETVHSR